MAIIEIDKLSLSADLLVPGFNGSDVSWPPHRLTSAKIGGDVFLFVGGGGSAAGLGVVSLSDKGGLEFDDAFATRFDLLNELALAGVGSVTQKVDGEVHVYTSGFVVDGFNSGYGLSVVDFTNPANPSILQTIADDQALGEVGINGGVDPLLASVNGKDFIVVASGRSDDIHTYQIKNNGQLGDVNTSKAEFWLSDGYTVAGVGDKTFIISFGDYLNGPMQVLELSGNGNLTPVYTLPASEPAIFNQQTKGMASIQVAGETYVFASEVTAGTILAFKLSSGGKLTLVDKIFPNAGDLWGSAEELKTFEHDGEAYLLSGGYGRSIAVFKIADGGSLIEVDELVMETGSLGRVVDMEVARDAGKTFFAVTTLAQNALTSYEFRDTYEVKQGGSGNNTISGTDDDDQIFGGKGADLLKGKLGDDLIEGNKGKDVVNGGGGNDDIYGNNGNDVLNGNLGNDFAFGGSGNDKMYGNDGRDFLVGESGKDALLGGDGDDRLFGGSGVDRLKGGQGNDSITDGSGEDDRLFGGQGNDVFVFVDDGKRDIIEDYEDGFDKINLEAEGGINFTDLTIKELGNNLKINYGNESILLKSADGKIEDFELSASDFIF